MSIKLTDKEMKSEGQNYDTKKSLDQINSEFDICEHLTNFLLMMNTKNKFIEDIEQQKQILKNEIYCIDCKTFLEKSNKSKLHENHHTISEGREINNTFFVSEIFEKIEKKFFAESEEEKLNNEIKLNYNIQIERSIENLQNILDKLKEKKTNEFSKFKNNCDNNYSKIKQEFLELKQKFGKFYSKNEAYFYPNDNSNNSDNLFENNIADVIYMINLDLYKKMQNAENIIDQHFTKERNKISENKKIMDNILIRINSEIKILMNSTIKNDTIENVFPDISKELDISLKDYNYSFNELNKAYLNINNPSFIKKFEDFIFEMENDFFIKYFSKLGENKDLLGNLNSINQKYFDNLKKNNTNFLNEIGNKEENDKVRKFRNSSCTDLNENHNYKHNIKYCCSCYCHPKDKSRKNNDEEIKTKESFQEYLKNKNGNKKSVSPDNYFDENPNSRLSKFIRKDMNRKNDESNISSQGKNSVKGIIRNKSMSTIDNSFKKRNITKSFAITNSSDNSLNIKKINNSNTKINEINNQSFEDNNSNKNDDKNYRSKSKSKVDFYLSGINLEDKKISNRTSSVSNITNVNRFNKTLDFNEKNKNDKQNIFEIFNNTKNYKVRINKSKSFFIENDHIQNQIDSNECNNNSKNKNENRSSKNLEKKSIKNVQNVSSLNINVFIDLINMKEIYENNSNQDKENIEKYNKYIDYQIFLLKKFFLLIILEKLGKFDDRNFTEYATMNSEPSQKNNNNNNNNNKIDNNIINNKNNKKSIISNENNNNNFNDYNLFLNENHLENLTSIIVPKIKVLTNELLIFNREKMTMNKFKVPLNYDLHGIHYFLDGCRYIVINEKIYISGGRDEGKYYKIFLEFDFAKNELRRLDDLCVSRAYHKMLYCKNKQRIYFLGGENNKSTEFYDFYNKSNIPLPNLKEGRSYLNAYITKDGKKLYTLFGMKGKIIESKYSPNVEVLNLEEIESIYNVEDKEKFKETIKNLKFKNEINDTINSNNKIKHCYLSNEIYKTTGKEENRWELIEYRNSSDLDMKFRYVGVYPLDNDTLVLVGGCLYREIDLIVAVYHLRRNDITKIDSNTLSEIRRRAKYDSVLMKILSEINRNLYK